MAPNQSSEENSKKKPKPSPLSKRFLSRKIEEMLQGQPDDNPDSISSNPFQEDDSDDSIKVSKVTFLLQYPFLILFGLVVAGGWLFFFIQYYSNPRASEVSIQIEKYAEWQQRSPLISTPILSDIDGDNQMDIGFADSLGYLQAVDPRSKEMIYQTFLGGRVIASLAVIEVDGEAPAEILATTERGKFFTINRQGDYLYPSRDEYFSEQIYAKPLVLPDLGIFYLVGMQGRVWGVGAQYGEVLWMNDNSTLAQNQEGIFPPPILLPLSTEVSDIPEYFSQGLDFTSTAENFALVVAGERGTIAAFHLASGGLRWERKLNDSFKAAPIVMEEKHLLVAGTQGGIWILRNGEIVGQEKLNETFISSPITGKFLPGLAEKRQALLMAESGNVFLAILTEEQPTLKIEQILSGDEGFIASPIKISSKVASDWSGDEQDKILAVSREGGVFLWALKRALKTPETLDSNMDSGAIGHLWELIPPYRLGYKVTATPVMADLNQDGHVEVVIGGETGKLSVLTLRITPPAFSPGESPSSQFLGNSFHYR